MTLAAKPIRPDAQWTKEARQLLKQLQLQQRQLQALIDAAEATPNAGPFQLFEEVRVIGRKRSIAAVVGKQGLILGRAEDGGGRWSYAVAVEGDETWSLDARNLESTGRFFTRDAIYSGAAVGVSVDRRGRSTIRARR